MLTTKEEICTWLGEMKIKKFTINKDLTVDLREDVNLSQIDKKQLS